MVIVLLTSYICYRIAFYAPPRKPLAEGQYIVPSGKIYDPYHDKMMGWIKETRATPHEDYTITSFDGLTLHGKYYECIPGAPIELMFHGYRGTAEGDMCGAMQRCFHFKRNAFIVDQRCSGLSDGHVITFGIKESRDCLSWVDFMIQHFGPDVKIILTGISMGAATVMTAAGNPLPKNVIGVLADCGYSSAKDIICKVIDDMKLPARLLYPFVKLAAHIYGHFDLEAASPIESMKKCTVPVIFFHGEDDAYVPCDMSRRCYEACAAPKKLHTVPGAGHGLCYMLDPQGYFLALEEMNKLWGI